MSHAYEWFYHEISLTYPLEIPEIFGGNYFQPPEKALIRGYPLEILGKSPHIWGGVFSQTFIATLSWDIYEKSSMKQKISWCSELQISKQDISGYERISDGYQRISHGYLTGYLLDIKGYCLDMCGYPFSGLPAPGTLLLLPWSDAWGTACDCLAPTWTLWSCPTWTFIWNLALYDIIYDIMYSWYHAWYHSFEITMMS